MSGVLAHALASSAQDMAPTPPPWGGGTSSERRHGALIALARAEFGTLTEGEKKLFKAAAEGKMADYSSGDKEFDDPANADNWGPKRTLQADRITWLCTDPNASKLVTHRGVQVKGARIDGALDLRFATILFPLYFETSSFQQTLGLENATMRTLALPGTHTRAIHADGARFKGDVLLRGQFSAEGEIRLLAASISGILDCSAAHFTNDKPYALNANGMNVKGAVFLRNAFVGKGGLSLLNATVGRSLDCEGAEFSSERGTALLADAAKVGGDVRLSHKFNAHGEVRLLGATIEGDLVCLDGRFSNDTGRALNADGLHVDGNVFLGTGFSADGAVHLLGVTIGGDLDCFKGHFSNETGCALNAARSKVEGDVCVCDGFKAAGTVDLSGAEVRGTLIWTRVDSPEHTHLDLRSAKIGRLWDDPNTWPSPGKLLLHGLTYDQLYDKAPADAETRLKWLRRQPKERFYPQPYEQLAEVLSKSGHQEEAKQILIGKAKDHAKFLSGPRAKDARLRPPFDHRWWWYKVFGPIIGYGYQPWRAAWWALAIVVLGWFFFWLGERGDIMTPTKVATYAVEGTGQQKKIAEDYANYNPLMYSIDTFVPIVDLRVASYYLPNANRGKELLTTRWFTWKSGSLLRAWLWFQIAAGWILTTLLVVGLTGLVRR